MSGIKEEFQSCRHFQFSNFLSCKPFHPCAINVLGVGYVYTSKRGSDLNWILSTFPLDLNWICFERESKVGQIAGQNWIGSAISRVNARRNRTVVVGRLLL